MEANEAMKAMARLREALEIAEKHVETLHSLVGCQNPNGEGRKIVWRDLKRIRAALSAAIGGDIGGGRGSI